MKKTIGTLILITLMITIGWASEMDMQKMIVVPDPTPDYVAQVWVDRDEGGLYYPGERIQVSFQVNKDSYIVLWNILPTGESYIIFPNQYHPDNFAQAGQVYTLPGPGYSLVIGPDIGRELVQIIASSHQFATYKEWESSFSMETPFVMQTRDAQNDLEHLATKMIVQPDPVKPTIKWTSAMTHFFVGRKPTIGTVNIHSVPSGASVFLDGNWLPNLNTPLTGLRLTAGSHYVELRKPGYLPYKLSFMVEADKTRDIVAQLVPEVQPAFLTVEPLPLEATVLLDGIRVGQGITRVGPLEPRTYTLRVEREGYVPFTGSLTLASGEDKVMKIQLDRVTGILNLRVTPTGSIVRINGTPYTLLAGALRVQLPFGPYSIQVDHPGYHSHMQSLQLAPGEVREVLIQLKPIQPKLTITSIPEGAGVMMGSVQIGITPFTLSMDPGVYPLTILKHGFIPQSFQVLLEPGKDKHIHIELKPALGKVLILPTVPCILYVDGSQWGRIQVPTTLELTPGQHELLFILPGHISHAMVLVIEAGEEITVTPQFVPLKP